MQLFQIFRHDSTECEFAMPSEREFKSVTCCGELPARFGDSVHSVRLRKHACALRYYGVNVSPCLGQVFAGEIYLSVQNIDNFLMDEHIHSKLKSFGRK